jgi:hypothetical protein
MGQRFYEATMPKFADQLERLKTNLEVLVAELRKQREQRQERTQSPGDESAALAVTCRGSARRAGLRERPVPAAVSIDVRIPLGAQSWKTYER